MHSSLPKRLRRLPLKGATLVAWQSQIHGVSGMAVSDVQPWWVTRCTLEV
jgi:hypothetical protein